MSGSDDDWGTYTLIIPFSIFNQFPFYRKAARR